MERPKGMMSAVALVVGLFGLPALHPLLLPAIGTPSHLLWFVHVLPVALLTWTHGRRVGTGTVLVSAALVAVGELLSRRIARNWRGDLTARTGNDDGAIFELRIPTHRKPRVSEGAGRPPEPDMALARCHHGCEVGEPASVASDGDSF